jgi:hypothetical protein
MAARSSWLLLLLVACGRTDHDNHVSATGGADIAGGSPAMSGGTGGANSAGGGGTGRLAPPSCLYPIKGLTPFNDPGLAAQSYNSRPWDVNVAPATWGGLAATYDVNGDLISDLIYLDGGAASPRYRLARTVPEPNPNPFDFEDADCAQLAELPVGRLFLRDLDADGVPDFVVGTTRGLQAFLNHEAGLEPVLDFEFRSSALSAAIINVGAVDLDDDGRIDLVAGFDLLDGDLSIDVGVLSFLQQPDGSLAIGGRFTAQDPPVFRHPPYAGYLAVGRFGSHEQGSAILVRGITTDSQGTVGDQTRFDGALPVPVVVPEVDEKIFQLLSLPTSLGHAYLLAVGSDSFFVLDLSMTPPRLVTRVPLFSEGSTSHEIGGGPESPRYFLVDLDHDGDQDFVEHSRLNQLTVHPNLANQGFAPEQQIGTYLATQVEAPFLEVGPGSAYVTSASADNALPFAYTLIPARATPNGE